ncbi:pentatricopeptide repeat-containing protein 1, mitochondrial [Thrips palmi]|uniref:Pentatricopeptide repeat-containing protein 1, mitochondrial n=1 Tax=Thrips palmi TaxID=161013 RepID=A0A6P8ZZ36_THRPL|nr:pentatricopeptide repeat-containing protein 1, mitochondrial [Thrips palmi]
MGHLLRVGVFHRLSKLLLKWGPADSARHIYHISRFLSSQNSNNEEDPKTENKVTSLTSVESRFYKDLSKFENDSKISLPRSPVKSEDFVAGPQDDPDTFGTLEKTNPYLENFKEGSEDDQREDAYVSELPNYLPQKEYVKRIKKLLAQRRFADALDVLQVTMIKHDRLKPSYYIYALLISYCGQTGYSKMAFKLFNDMKKRGLNVPASIYTSLFNSFSNSPYPSDGLKRTRHLFSSMIEKGIPPNEITCHAVIKAFAKCESLEDAFKVADYMMSRKMVLTGATMSNLLLACRADREAGFRHALLVYKKMAQYQIKPDLYHFNMFLNCVRDCGIGDLDSTVDLFKMLGVKDADKLTSGNINVPQLDTGYAWEESESVSAETAAGTSKEPVTQLPLSSESNSPINLQPNLFAREPTLGCLVSITEIATCQDRLFLLGGVEGFLSEMASHNLKPDIRTANILLDCSPESCVAEQHLLKIISKLELTPDLIFFNSLILRRIRRQQYSEAKDVLTMIAHYGLLPDMQTYTNLAMTCRSRKDGYELLQSLDASGLRPGIEFMTAMMGCATICNDLKYVKLVLDVIEYEEMAVNSRFLKKIDSFYEKCQNILRMRPAKFAPKTLDEMKRFCKTYPKWKDEVKIETPYHPWQQFREKYPSETEADTTYLEKYVEPNALKHKFPRLGPTASPVTRKAKLKKLRDENPDMFQRKGAAKKILSQLQGFESVVIEGDSTKN